MNRHWISILFLSIMLGQLIPVNQVGNFLYNNQLTEEICDAGSECDDTGKHSKEGSEKLDCVSPSHFPGTSLFPAYPPDYNSKQVCFISRHGDDVLTPPPLA